MEKKKTKKKSRVAYRIGSCSIGEILKAKARAGDTKAQRAVECLGIKE